MNRQNLLSVGESYLLTVPNPKNGVLKNSAKENTCA